MLLYSIVGRAAHIVLAFDSEPIVSNYGQDRPYNNSVMSKNLDTSIAAAPDPEVAALRVERLLEDATARKNIDSLAEELLPDFLTLIGTSNFLFHILCRRPDWISLVGRGFSHDKEELMKVKDLDALRLYKYRSLLQLTWMDISNQFEYRKVLHGLSLLAESILQHALRLVLDADEYEKASRWLAVFALGKLGAAELNYSSDIDLIFVSANAEETDAELQEIQLLINQGIRKLSQAMEEKTQDGFLYRVDLKLRPWGSSGPLCMGLDATEQYYESSSEPWERFAWLRSRLIAGSTEVGKELELRMRPFVFMRSLSTEDLERFVQIKNDMARARKRRGKWNVKVGEGGIRDIEFFTQILQIVNAAEHDELQKTNTVEILNGLTSAGVLKNEEGKELLNSYLFLRRLENRLQMVDERQTHELPDARNERLKIARSLRIDGTSNDEIMDNFENALFMNQSVAKMYFEKILPQQGG